MSRRSIHGIGRALVPDAARRAARALQLTSNPRSARSYMALTSSSPPAGRVTLKIRGLEGGSITVRPGTSDIHVVRDTFLAGYHLPPRDLGEDLRLIWDLGANIGTTMAQMACLYPRARIVGVELDAYNAALCRLNVEPWRDRCEVIEAAVWPQPGEVEYLCERGDEWSAEAWEGGGRFARALPPNELPGAPDFVKMDIEGAEARVLRENSEWLERVRSIKVEVHGRYSVSDCIADLEPKGFSALPDEKHPQGVVARRVQ